MAGIGEIDAAGIEIDRAVEDYVDGCAAWQFKFRAPCKENGSDSDCRADASSDARALGALRSDPSDARANSRGFQNSSDVSPLVCIAVNFAFFIGRFVATSSGVGWDSIEVHNVAVR